MYQYLPAGPVLEYQPKTRPKGFVPRLLSYNGTKRLARGIMITLPVAA